MRPALIALCLGLLGCAPSREAECPTAIPVRALETKRPERSRYLSKSIDDATNAVISALNAENVLSFYWREENFARLRTVPMPEPDLTRIHRRSFIYIHVLGDVPSVRCSKVEFRWYTERRGFEESEWKSSQEDKDFEPLIWPALSSAFSTGNCLEMEP